MSCVCVCRYSGTSFPEFIVSTGLCYLGLSLPGFIACHPRLSPITYLSSELTIVSSDERFYIMKWQKFHHPDLCLTVIRRRITEEALNLIAETAITLVSRGRNLWQPYYPTCSAYHSAMHRLRKTGLIAYRRTGGKTPVLRLTAEGESRILPACRRRPPWPSSWNGIWYLLIYDVPEKERAYRDVLRSFLRKQRMGCLQKSAWITPLDIRPEYDDLSRAGAVDDFSFLWETRTVLGRDSQDIVETAWRMSRLHEYQRHYLEIFGQNLKQVEVGNPSSDDLCALVRDEYQAYLTMMDADPFLPRPLWPTDYLGEKAWNFHRKFLGSISARL